MSQAPAQESALVGEQYDAIGGLNAVFVAFGAAKYLPGFAGLSINEHPR